VGTKTSVFRIRCLSGRCTCGNAAKLAAATIDASSLPGTCSPSESTLQTTEVAGVSHDGFRGTKIMGPARDAQYKTKCRNDLNKVDTMDKLNAAATGGNRPSEDSKVNVGRHGRQRGRHAAAYVLGQPAVDLFLRRTPLAIAHRSVDTYRLLLIHFQRIACSEGDGWELANVDLDYFEHALSDIRTYGRLPRANCF
jgi:hypothetical protein